MNCNQDPYLEFLRNRTDRVFYRVPYPGNAGDSLIQFATQHILDDLRIRTTVDPRRADVIVVPGGNPSMWPDIGPERWRTLWKCYPQAEFVVGPAEFRNGHTDWVLAINTEGSQVSGLFARDPESFKNLSEAGLRPGISLGLCHDPALYLRNSAWLLAHRDAASEEYDLAAFRDDHETNIGHAAVWRLLKKTLPGCVYHPIMRYRAAAMRQSHIKMARKLGGGVVSLVQNDVSRQRFEVFVEAIRAAREVHTDRLHVLLLSAMLGKKIYAYPTSQGKLEGVYRHCLMSWANVTLVGESANDMEPQPGAATDTMYSQPIKASAFQATRRRPPSSVR